MQVDVFIDLTAPTIAGCVETAVAAWQRPEQLGSVAGRVTLVTREPVGPAANLPAEWRRVTSVMPTGHFNAAMDDAGSRRVALLAVIGLVDVGVEALGILQQSLDADPMFGFAVPRVSCADRCCIARLTRNGLGASGWLPRAILGELPESYVLLETAAPCVLIAPQIAGNFGYLEAGFENVAGTLLACMAAARRCGFRTVSSNRAVVSLAGVGCGTPTVEPVAGLSRNDADQLGRLVPDLVRSWDQSGAASATLYEELYSALPRASAARPRQSLLMDLRNLAPVHNGTTHAILGLMTAFREVADGWSISLLTTDQGVAFHDLPRRFSDWPIHTEVPDRSFTVAFRPSQPWHLQELVDLHRVSILSACLLLDTIAWDVAYCAPPHLEGVWQFLAAYADGLLYDSEFTRRRFLTRFPAGANLPGTVTHFSFDPSDYIESTAAPGANAGGEGHILVVGNHLDHKDIRQTVRTLATAFPYRQIRVLGPTDIVSPLVSAVPSGALATTEIHKLYAGAGCVVYPSFYEGFGFPILKALAYGRTVFVRRSALVDELAPLFHGGGRLVPFDRREDLVDLVGRLSEGRLLEGMMIGDRRGASPRGWQDVASDTDRFLASLIDERSPERWQARDRAVRQLISYRT